MNHRLLPVVTVVLLVCAALADPAAAATGHHPVSLQFLHPLGTSPDPATTTNFRLSVLFGRSGGVSGLDLNAGAAATDGDLSALQLTGLYNRVGGNFRGLGLTGGVQHLRRSGSGLLFTAGANYIEGSFVGVQTAGLLNLNRTHFAGAQISGLANLNDGEGTFLQLASVANINAGAFAGLQISAFLNAANSAMAGGQVAVVNFADALNGFQVGAVNLTRDFDGVQFGLLNYGRNVEGTPVGLINMSNDDRREWLFNAGNFPVLQVGFRTVVNGWSSIVSFGEGDSKGDVKKSYFLGWNYGHILLTRPDWELTLDAGFAHIIPTATDDPAKDDRLHYALQARLLGDWKLKEHLGIVGAVGLVADFDHYSTHASSQTDALFSGGIVLYR